MQITTAATLEFFRRYRASAKLVVIDRVALNPSFVRYLRTFYPITFRERYLGAPAFTSPPFSKEGIKREV